MTSLVSTTRFTRGILPHWEVKGGCYFVTVRCHDSLPREALGRLRLVARSLREIKPASLRFIQLQRRYFQTLEKYLDAGLGKQPLRDPRAAQILASSLANLGRDGIEVPHFTIMSNHWHALLAPASPGLDFDLHRAIARLKGSSARRINLTLDRTGPLWQREWFDRWIRDEKEWSRCVEYIRSNPVKAGLVKDWREHPWTR